MAPEYVKHGHLSAKSDVFSFGVLVLEIVTGQKTSRIIDSSTDKMEDNLISYVSKTFYFLLKKKNVNDLKIRS